MTEEILKIKAQELETVRLIFTGEDAQTVELTLENARTWAAKCADKRLGGALLGLVDGIAFFSKKDKEPSVEFVIPIKR